MSELSNIPDGSEPCPEHGALEPLPGHVSEQMVQCNRTGCCCLEGKLHGPYFYRIWREGKRVQKVYVPKGEVESVLRQTHLYNAAQESLRQLAVSRQKLTKRIAREFALFEAGQARARRTEAQRTEEHGSQEEQMHGPTEAKTRSPRSGNASRRISRES